MKDFFGILTGPLKNILRRNKPLYRFVLRVRTFLIPDKYFLQWRYRREMGKELDLDHPRAFNAKIQWLKLNWHDPRLSVCADKYAVRAYVYSRLGPSFLTRLHGVYEAVSDIVPDDLPDAFALKATHGSGQNVICRNKKEMDWPQAFAMLKNYMSNNHYYSGREFSYKDIAPRIICEEYLDEGGRSPIDYKIYCFNGEPRFIEAHFNRFYNHTCNIYDLEWNFIPVRSVRLSNYQGSVQPPLALKEMLACTRKLAEDLIFVRVDLYCIRGKIYFGEMTFYPDNGFCRFIPEDFDDFLGGYLVLPGLPEQARRPGMAKFR